MVKTKTVEELQRECARLARIRDMPEEVQARYAPGILKLEQRIGELRAASGLTLDDFVRVFTNAVMVEKLNAMEINRVDFEALNDFTYMASEAWKRGDPEGIGDGMKGIGRVLFRAKMKEEEAR